MTVLEQLRASEDPSDGLMAARQAEIRALMPVPTCCARAKKFVRLWPDGKWAARTLECDGTDDGHVHFCPCCGIKLPAVRRKAVQSHTLCVSDGDRCRCGERLPCWCDPMESAFEIVGPGLFYIQDSRQFVGNDVLWWRPSSGGYTCQIDEAGLYDAEFCAHLRSTDLVWRWEDIRPLATSVVDGQRMSGLKPAFEPRKDPVPTVAPDHPVCAVCGRLATCFGAYDGDDPAYGCSTCCAHGNEGGWCEPCSDATAAARLLGQADADTQHESRTYEDVLNIVNSDDIGPYRVYQESLAKGPGWAHGGARS